MGAAKHDGLAVPGRVVLAHEQPFRIGSLRIDPPTRQVELGELHETLEPRVMQVLVALYQAGGIVTRDELVERCWDGRVVGDDAINRVVSRLRHVADGLGNGSFSIETITKVGYRLTVTEPGFAGAGAQSESPGPVDSRRRKMIGAMAVAGTVIAVGAPAAIRWIGGGHGPPPEAEDLYQRALMLRGSASHTDNRQAIGYLREAVRIAPEYGEAWGALAFAYRSAILGGSPAEVAGYDERLQEALRQADRFDPGNADAAFARRITALFFGRWATMEPVYRELAGRFPDHPTGHYTLGSLLMDVGRWREAGEALRTAKARQPLAPITRYKLTVSLWSAGQISEAEHEIDEAMHWSIHSAIWQTKIKLLAMTGRPDTALAVIDDPTGRPADTTEQQLARWRLFLAAMISRSESDIDRAAAGLVASARQIATPVPEAFQCAMLGRPELALSILEGCYLGIGEWAAKRPADPGGNAAHPMFQPQAKSLWHEPRFKRILEGIGLEQYWRQTGSLPDYRRA